MAPRFDVVSAAKEFDAVNQALAQAVETTSPEYTAVISKAVIYLADARVDIRRNVKIPIVPAQLTALIRFLTNVVDFLDHLVDGAVLTTPTSPGLVDEGYELLDQAGIYKGLANHHFNRNVQAARRQRPTDAVDVEIDSIAGKASLLKSATLQYIENVSQVFADLLKGR